MRVCLRRGHLWRWWWPLGGVAVIGLTITGVAVRWSAAWWAAVAVVAAVYLGVPVMAANLGELGAADDQPELASDARPADRTAKNRPVSQMTMSVRPSPGISRDDGPQVGHGEYERPGAGGADEVSGGLEEHGIRRRPMPPPSDLLPQRIAAVAGNAFPGSEPCNSRPWRRVGSPQFASLVQALGTALPSADIADDTADLSGVTRHLIRKGRDTAKQRWLAVLEQAIDDQVDDVLCAEALKQTNSEQLQSTISDWMGFSRG